MPDRRFSIAPMLDWTDRHARYFLRGFSRRHLLYTEMISTGALLHGDRDRFLAHHPAEAPLAIQLGGSDADELARCADYARDAGYDEVNLNCGCPSDRVQSGRFGACLMAEPRRVADCVAAMAGAGLPVTVKSRIGIDHQDSFEFLLQFIDSVAEAGCRTFIVHARKAWLNGLSPKQNREIPPLRYEVVHRLKRERPQLEVIVNGGIDNLDQALEQLELVDGVMVGRAAYRNPAILCDLERRVYGDDGKQVTRGGVYQRYLGYVDDQLASGVPLARLAAPLLGLFQGCHGARAYRRRISENAHRRGAGIEVLRDALGELDEHGWAA